MNTPFRKLDGYIDYFVNRKKNHNKKYLFSFTKHIFLFHGTGRGRSLELSVDRFRTNHSSPGTD